jgi:xanthine dehydrogenase molybdenum-binding subunit
MVAAHDVGRPMNPSALEGQIEGGLIMGLGMALSEEFTPGETKRFGDYRVPRTTDLPEIVNIILQEECPEGPFGAKGVGEVPAVGPASAIANAVANATGERPLRLPIRRTEV